MSGKLPHAPRHASPTKTRDGTTILDIDHYAPFLLNAIGSAWQRTTSAIYREKFDLSISDWRVVAMLNIEPEITANRVCEVIRIDKAAVSRSLKLLASRGYVTFVASPTDHRKRRWRLSDKGLQLHADLMAEALACEAEMTTGLTPDELATCLSAIRKMLRNFS